MGKLKLFDPS